MSSDVPLQRAKSHAPLGATLSKARQELSFATGAEHGDQKADRFGPVATLPDRSAAGAFAPVTQKSNVKTQAIRQRIDARLLRALKRPRGHFVEGSQKKLDVGTHPGVKKLMGPHDARRLADVKGDLQNPPREIARRSTALSGSLFHQPSAHRVAVTTPGHEFGIDGSRGHAIAPMRRASSTASPDPPKTSRAARWAP